MRIALVAFVLAVAPVARAADAGALVCPSSAPTDGSACTGTGACEYGADAHGLCSTFASCASGSWKVVAPSPSCGTSANDCPSSFATVGSGVVCPLADQQSTCIYADGICACPGQCLGANAQLEPQWVCHAWSQAQVGCPAIRPAIGTTCTDEGQVCIWDGCCGGFPLGPDERCSGGVWTFYPLDDCACGGGAPACVYAPLTPEAGAPDAATKVGAEPDERLTAGCGCSVVDPTSSTALIVAPFALLVAVMDRRRRRPR